MKRTETVHVYFNKDSSHKNGKVKLFLFAHLYTYLQVMAAYLKKEDILYGIDESIKFFLCFYHKQLENSIKQHKSFSEYISSI